MTNNTSIKKNQSEVADASKSSTIHKRGLKALTTLTTHVSEAEKLYQQGLEYDESEDYDKAFACFSAAADFEHGEATYKLATYYRGGNGTDENEEKYIEWFKKACDLKVASAIFRRALHFKLSANGFEKDLTLAYLSFKEAAELDYKYTDNLAECYLHGEGVEKDVRKAITCYEVAMTKGCKHSIYSLSNLLFGIDDERAFALLNKYVDEFEPDDWESNFKLGVCYWHGIGVERNLPNAKNLFAKCDAQYADCEFLDDYFIVFINNHINGLVSFFETLAAFGFKNATHFAAKTLLFDDFVEFTEDEIERFSNAGLKLVAQNKSSFANDNYESLSDLYKTWRLSRNDKIKKKYLLFAVNLGIADAQLRLANHYFNGSDLFEQDFTKAFIWYEKAALNGDNDAQNSLGDCYYWGHGVQQDYKQAVYWFEKAAESEHSEALFNLGHCYENAQGVEENAELAANYYRRAAEHDYADAQYELGLSYANGYGVDEDLLQCAFWIRKAAEQGHEGAQEYLEKLEDELS